MNIQTGKMLHVPSVHCFLDNGSESVVRDEKVVRAEEKKWSEQLHKQLEVRIDVIAKSVPLHISKHSAENWKRGQKRLKNIGIRDYKVSKKDWAKVGLSWEEVRLEKDGRKEKGVLLIDPKRLVKEATAEGLRNESLLVGYQEKREEVIADLLEKVKKTFKEKDKTYFNVLRKYDNADTVLHCFAIKAIRSLLQSEEGTKLMMAEDAAEKKDVY